MLTTDYNYRTIITSPMKTYLVLLQLCFTIMSYITFLFLYFMCLYTVPHSRVPTGVATVVDKYINACICLHLYIIVC